MAYQVKLTTFANNVARKFNPEVKKSARASLKELAGNPFLGKELQAELSGFWSYRFLRYRIVYKINSEHNNIIVWAIGHRRDIYENMSEPILGISQEK
jgi:mRNA interferase RelE/StbE